MDTRPERERKGWFSRLAFWLFGTASKSHDVTYVPGNGTHGGGTGQIPPMVPYSPEWDEAAKRKAARRGKKAHEADQAARAEAAQREATGDTGQESPGA